MSKAFDIDAFERCANNALAQLWDDDWDIRLSREGGDERIPDIVKRLDAYEARISSIVAGFKREL